MRRSSAESEAEVLNKFAVGTERKAEGLLSRLDLPTAKDTVAFVKREGQTGSLPEGLSVRVRIVRPVGSPNVPLMLYFKLFLIVVALRRKKVRCERCNQTLH